MTKPGNPRDKVKQLSATIRAAQKRREAEPAYVLQTRDGFVLPMYATDLENVRADVKQWARRDQGRVRICRLEPVESTRGRK